MGKVHEQMLALAAQQRELQAKDTRLAAEVLVVVQELKEHPWRPVTWQEVARLCDYAIELVNASQSQAGRIETLCELLVTITAAACDQADCSEPR